MPYPLIGQTPSNLAQKDTDARWTKKGGQDTTVTRTTLNIDKDTKRIAARQPSCAAANVHDSQVLDACCAMKRQAVKEVWTDSAYRLGGQEQSLETSPHENQILERAYRNKPLTEVQELGNTKKSRVRARVPDSGVSFDLWHKA